MQSEQQPVCARCRSVQFISFRFVFLTGQGNQLADIDIKDGGGGGDFRHRQLQEMGKVESERNRIQVAGEAQLRSGSDHAHYHSHSYYYSHFESYFIYGIWYIMKMKRGARVFQVPQEEMHSQWEAQESSESFPVAVAMLHMLTTHTEH